MDTYFLIPENVPVESDDDFEKWVTKRSFAMAAPVSRIATFLFLGMLFVADPMFYAKGLWEKNSNYFSLFIWHLVCLGFYSAIWIASQNGRTHAFREKLIAIIVVSQSLLFAWFGVLSWFLIGDFSPYAFTILLLATIFCTHGYLRRAMYLLSSLSMSVAIILLDATGTFLASGVYVNLIGVVAVAFVVDGYVMNSNLALFREKRLVEYERSRADSVLYNAMPVSIANDLKQNKPVKAEKFQNMTVLFADIVGFTKFSASVPPDAVVHILNQIFSEFDELVEKFKVEKIKTIGDAYMVVGKGNVSDVADISTEMLKTMGRYNALNGVSFELRIGIHVGATVAGIIGLKRFLYDVWGDAVNTASRMESTGTPGKIQISEAFYRALGDGFLYEDRGVIDLKGKGLMHTYYLIGRKPLA